MGSRSCRTPAAAEVHGAAEATPTEAPQGEPQAAAAPAKSRKGLWLSSSALILVALGWVLAVVAVPVHEAPVEHELGEPTLLAVSPPAGFHVNLSEAGGKHYLAVTLTTEVRAFPEAEVGERATDPLYRARLSDAVRGGLSSSGPVSSSSLSRHLAAYAPAHSCVVWSR